MPLLPRFGWSSAAPLLAMVLGLMAAPASADIIYDSNGFSAFTAGALSGQDGWADITSAELYTPVVKSVESNNVVLIVGGGETGGENGIVLDLGENLVAQYGVVKVSFDVMRVTGPTMLPDAPLLWGWRDGGDPSMGGQGALFGNEVTIPISGAGEQFTQTVFDAFKSVELEWNFVTGTASGWYDGNLIGQLMITNMPSMTAFAIGFPNFDGGEGHEPLGWAYIDNFRITGSPVQAVPEPVSLALFVTTGVAGAFARTRLRRKSA